MMDNLQQPIFTNLSGNPLRIFVEASSVLERPKLIRSLRSHGAQTEQWVKNADIILVDETIPDSLTFAAQWPQKISLSYRWAHQAIREGRCCGPRENWGGYLVPVNTPDSSETKSPLPTPRQTPISNGHAVVLPTGTPIPSSQIPFPRASGSPASFATQDQPAPHPTQVFPHIAAPPSNSDAAVYPPQSIASFMANMTSSAPSPVIQTLLDMIAKGTANPAFAPFPQAQSSLPQFPTSYPTTSSSAMDFATIPPHRSVYSDSMQVQSSYYNAQAIQDRSHEIYPGSRSLSRSMTPHTYAQSVPTKRKFKYQEESMLPTDSLRDKGKGKARSGVRGRSHKRHSVESNESSPERSSSVSLSDSRRSPAEGIGKIFIKKHGQPVQFVVDMAVRNRRDLLMEIKNYGGIIVPDMPQADYIILSPHADNFEAELRRTITLDKPAVQADFVRECVKEGAILDKEEFSFDGVVVKGKRGKPNRPVDLAAMREVLNPKTPSKQGSRKLRRSKSMEPPVKDRKKKTPRKTTQPEAAASSTDAVKEGNSKVSNRSRKEEGRAVKKGRGRIPMPPPEPQPEANMDVESGHSVPRSPSPPFPPNFKVVQFTEGRNRFTPEDEEYFTSYVAHLLRGDPDMALKGITAKLTEKMPHHTERSWASFCRKKGSDIIEQARKKAYIALRKERSFNQSRISTASNEMQDATQHTTPVSDYTVEDLVIIVEYLSGGVPEGLSDDEAFAQLARECPCRAAATWEQFWDQHNEAIMTRLQMLK